MSASGGGGATAAGTAAYAQRFESRVAPGQYRRALGWTLSSVGLGTYLGPASDAADRAYLAAITAAVEGGVNVLDTAVNYRFERSERVLGRALVDLSAAGFGREEIVVATKGGYVPSPDPGRYFQDEVVRLGLARPSDLVAGCHSLAPGYLRHQLEVSLTNLGLDAVDVYYVHNPEQQLDEVDGATFLARLRAAFEVLERAVDEGRLAVYGTATWNGYRTSHGAALSLEALVRLARDLAGDRHHFRVVQLPFNLAMPEALCAPTQLVGRERVPLLEAAARLGVTVMTSASLLQGRLARGLPAPVRHAAVGLTTDAQRALQLARSAPGVTSALVGMGRPDHVSENLALLEVTPLSATQVAEAICRPDS